MDSLQKEEPINRCKDLNYRFRGSLLADFPGSSVMKNDKTFMIMNDSPSGQPGSNWLIFAQFGGQIFFSGILGKNFYDYILVYKNMRRTIHKVNQLLIKIQNNHLVQC